MDDTDKTGTNLSAPGYPDKNYKISEKVKAGSITANPAFCRNNDKQGYSRRDFWLHQWQDMQTKNVHNSLNCKDRSEKWREIMESGKTPVEAFEAFIDDLDKSGDKEKFQNHIFENDEMRQKWETSRAEGKSEEFWYEYWDKKQEKHPFLGKIFGHPRDIQDQWKKLKSEGKEPDEIWRTIADNRWGWRHHNGHHGGWRHRSCSYYHRRQEFFCKKKEHDESDLYQQFDF